MEITQLALADFKIVPWKNGKGSTKELRFENLKDDEYFAWRLSMAPIITDGVFSDFSGYDRKLLLIEGDGMTLSHDNGQTDNLTNRFDMASFDGGWRTGAKLHQGEILDFNVMTRQSVCNSRVEAFAGNDHHELSVHAGCFLIYVLDSALVIHPPESDSIRLAAGCLLEVRRPTAGLWGIAGEGFICVQIDWD